MNRPEYDVLDLTKKFSPILQFFNRRNIEINKPDFSIPMSIDESLRSSKSKSCAIKYYMPAKPAKSGEKSFLLVDSELFCYKIIYQFPCQFSETDGSLLDLMQKIIPIEFQNCGLKVICDNYFVSMDVLLDYQKKNIALLGTVRSMRFQRFFEKPIFNALLKIVGKKQFKRNTRAYEDSNKQIRLYFYSD